MKKPNSIDNTATTTSTTRFPFMLRRGGSCNIGKSSGGIGGVVNQAKRRTTKSTTTPSFVRLLKRRQFDDVIRMLQRIDADPLLDVIDWMYGGTTATNAVTSANSLATSSGGGASSQNASRRRGGFGSIAGFIGMTLTAKNKELGAFPTITSQETEREQRGEHNEVHDTRQFSDYNKPGDGSTKHQQSRNDDDGRYTRDDDDDKDPNPLHVVIRHRAPVHVVDSVIAIMKNNDNKKNKLKKPSEQKSSLSYSWMSMLDMIQVVHEELVNDDGMNALHLACAMCCDVAVVRRLLRGPSIVMPALAKDRMGRHPIHWACDASCTTSNNNDHDGSQGMNHGLVVVSKTCVRSEASRKEEPTDTTKTTSKRIIHIANRIPKHTKLEMQCQHENNMVRTVIRLVRMYPDCTAIKDYMGMTPLDIAIRTGADHRIIAFLNRYNNNNNNSPRNKQRHKQSSSSQLRYRQRRQYKEQRCSIVSKENDQPNPVGNLPPSPELTKTKSETTTSTSVSSFRSPCYHDDDDKKEIIGDDDDDDEVISVPRHIRVLVRDTQPAAATTTTDAAAADDTVAQHVEHDKHDHDNNASGVSVVPVTGASHDDDDASSLGKDTEIRNDGYDDDDDEDSKNVHQEHPRQ